MVKICRMLRLTKHTYIHSHSEETLLINSENFPKENINSIWQRASFAVFVKPSAVSLSFLNGHFNGDNKPL